MARKKSSDNSILAYKDRRLEDRVNEQWEDIPGLDGYFLVSDYGRINE